MLVAYYELNDELKLRGPFQTDSADFKNYFRHLPKDVHQVLVLTEHYDLWLWNRPYSWRLLSTLNEELERKWKNAPSQMH